MRIFALIFIVCITTVNCDIKLTEDELIISKINEALGSLNSVQCKKDLNSTVNGYREHKAWAIASKRDREEKILFT